MKTGFLLWSLVLTLAFAPVAHAQKSEKKHISFRDSLDGAFDMSDFLIDANGFIPIPTIITEPAVGGFGGALIPVFIKRRPPLIGQHNGRQVVVPTTPDITGVGGFYTANNSWGVMAARSGTFIKPGIKYRIAGGYLNMNLSFYRDMPVIGQEDVEMKFNIQMIPAYLSAIKRIGYSRWHAGLQYLLLNANVRYVGDLPIPLPDEFSKELHVNKLTSQLSGVIEFDNRDNPFTPDKGIRFHVDGGFSDNIIGSDFDFQRINYSAFMYTPFRKNLIGGLRLDGQQAFGDVPFYMLPFIDLRGVEAGRYQGMADLLAEGEVRWDFVPRWSVVGFSGAGKAFDKWSEFGSSKWVWNYGGGFRYLLARKFGLRMGVDLAKGPDSWGYYITFGSNWLR